MRATSVDLCSLEHYGSLGYTGSLFESAPYFTNTICSELVSAEALNNVEDGHLRYASLRSRGEDEQPHMFFVLG